MDITLYLIRHARTAWNAKKRIQGLTDIPLDETGRKQAHALAERLATAPLDEIYSSPLMRARETAEIVALKHPQLKVRFNDNLVERDVGLISGMNINEAFERFPQWAQKVKNQSWHAVPPPGGEHPQALTRRAMRALDEIIARHDGKTVAVVSHGGTINTLVSKLFGLTYQDAIRLHFRNTSVTHLRLRNKYLSVYRLGDDGHVEQLGR